MQTGSLDRVPSGPFLRSAALGILAVPLTAAPLLAQETVVNTKHYQLQVQPIVEGLDHPWGLAFLPDGRFLVTERNSGQLRLGTDEGDLTDPIAGVPEVFRFKGETRRSQAGLFDVAVDPEFSEENPYVYLSYSKPTDHGAAVTITRARLVEDGNGGASLEEMEDVFEMKQADQDSSGLHFGGRMAFHPDEGTLFLSIGERRNISRAQDKEDQAGSILHMTKDGSPAQDNPFLGEEDGDDWIYSWGNRNPQGLAVRSESGELWSNDHGPLGGDEVNKIEAGQNYGWPYVTAAPDYSGAPLGVEGQMDGMVPPVHVFEETVAPSGLAFYEGEMFSRWQGDMLNGSLAQQALIRLAMDGEEVTGSETIEIGRRIRDVEVAADGSVWVITEHEDGEVLRLMPGEE